MELSGETKSQEESYPPKHKVKIYPQEYHGVDIKIVELDHDGSWQAGRKYKMPENWREILTEQISGTTGPIAPEYCMPDLEKNAFAELGTGEIARITSEDLRITSFFGHVSKLAGMQGRTLLATDIANTNWYALFEIASGIKVDIKERLKLEDFSYDYGTINPSEYKVQISNDARHLVAARGLMQEALARGDKQILAIWAPKHAERIADYIKRQKEFESVSSAVLRSPKEFKSFQPREEQKKMALYGRPPPAEVCAGIYSNTTIFSL